MRVLLVNAPYTPEAMSSQAMSSIDEPLGILYLAAMIRDKHTVKVIDPQVRCLSEEEILQEAEEFGPDILGVSIGFGSQMSRGSVLARLARNKLYGTKVILGGNSATFHADQLVKEGTADAVIVGEGELAFREFVDAVESGASLESVPSVVFEGGSGLVTTGRKQFDELDMIPFPAREYLESDGYFRNVVTSRGCAFTCMYCSTKAMWGPWRARSPGNVIEEVRQLAAGESGSDFISIADDNFTVDKNRALAVAKGIAPLGLRWGCLSRIEFVDEEMIECFAGSGASGIYFGIESGSERILRSLGRSATVEEIREKCTICMEHGILPTCSFMIGIPGETIEDARQTFDLMRSLNTWHVQLHVFTPLPGTPVFENPEAYSVTIEDDEIPPGVFEARAIHRTEHLSSEMINDLYAEGVGIAELRAREYANFLAKYPKVDRAMSHIREDE